MTDEPRYRKLLRWYPKPWRERNGDALLGVMLDEAERCGRTGPSRGERWSAFAHGVGMRLDAALAWRLAIIAIVMTACRVLWLFVALWEPIAWISDLVVPQVVAAAPVLLVIALVAAVRERGFLPAGAPCSAGGLCRGVGVRGCESSVGVLEHRFRCSRCPPARSPGRPALRAVVAVRDTGDVDCGEHRHRWTVVSPGAIPTCSSPHRDRRRDRCRSCHLDGTRGVISLHDGAGNFCDDADGPETQDATGSGVTVL